eukprot:7076854-Alexandrium_andersonii.AAC.1
MGPVRWKDALAGEGRNAPRVALSNCRHARPTCNSRLRVPTRCSPLPWRKWRMLARNMTHPWRMILDAVSSGGGG